MPAIIVTDYTWRQTSETIVISTRLVGHPKKVDLFAIDNYMKASYPPFILELFLWARIVEQESECAIGEETAIFTLKKEETGLEWPSLVMEGLDKDKKRAFRSRALELARVHAEERTKARSEKRRALQKQAVRAQIDLDTMTLNRIEAMRDSHRREAMRELEEWRSRAEQPMLNDICGEIQENRKAYRAPLKWFGDESQAAISQETATDLEVSNPEAVAAEDTQEKKNGPIEYTVQENSSGGLAGGEIVKIGANEIQESNLLTEAKPKDDEQNKLLSEGKNGDSTKVENTDSSSSDSSDSNGSSEESQSAGKNKSTIKEMDEKALRRYYRRKEKENVNRGRELVRRLLNGKTGCRTRGGGRIFDEPTVPTPRPRRCGTIDVKFSERQFPTPARESQQLEEQEWLEKQAEARRKSGFVSEDLSAEEQDPLWLKDKGDEFFKAGNYLAAISAYTHGIKLSDKMSSLYVNRSAAHYASENYRRCAEDCSRALELMVPKCEGNRDSRARCHARLGAALCKLSAPQHGIPELEAALKLAPENETIKRDLQVAKRYFEIRD